MNDNKKLQQARQLLRKVHDYSLEDKSKNPRAIAFNHYTFLIFENDLNPDEVPMIEIIKDQNLLKLYDYTIRKSKGDPFLDDFDSYFEDNNGSFDIENIFIDIFFALIKINENNICRVMDFKDKPGKLQ